MNARQFILPLIIFILGVIFTIVGALFKVLHWPYAPELLILGTVVEVVGLIVLIFILIKHFLKT